MKDRIGALPTFVLTGGAAAAVNIGSRILLSLVMRYELAVALAYLIGMTTAFSLARRYVFEPSDGGAAGEYIRFAMVNAVSFCQVWLVSVGLSRFAFPAMDFRWHAETVAHVIGVISPVLLSYFAHKHFTFRNGGKAEGVTP